MNQSKPASTPYTRRNLERRAAEFYAKLQKDQAEWKSVADLTPQLQEFEHRLAAGEYEEAGILLNSIDYEHLYRWGENEQLVKMRQSLAQHAEALSSPLQVDNLRGLGRSSQHLGDLERAFRYDQEAYQLATALGDKMRQIYCLDGLGSYYREKGLFPEALARYKHALKTVEEIGDRELKGRILGNLGDIYHSQGDDKNSTAHYREALEIARSEGDVYAQSVQWQNLGLVSRAAGQLRAAMESYRTSLEIAVRIGARRLELENYIGIGSVYALWDKWEEATRYHQQALEIAKPCGYAKYESVVYSLLADIYLLHQQVETSTRLRRLGLSISRKIQHPYSQGYHWVGLARDQLVQGQPKKAIVCCDQALVFDLPKVTYRALVVRGIACLYCNSEEAHRTFQQALIHCQAILGKTNDLFEARYTLPLALLGEVVSNPATEWSRRADQEQHLTPVLAAYRAALAIGEEPLWGMIRLAHRDLGLVCSAGVEGLDSITMLLDNELHTSPAHQGDT